jgi:hypothetical protein
MHPSSSFPGNIAILDGSNAFADQVVFAVYNPTASAIDATVIGSCLAHDGAAYAETSAAQTIAVQPGATLYGRYTSVNASAAGLICYF